MINTLMHQIYLFFTKHINGIYQIMFLFLRKQIVDNITIQWHITTKCTNNCMHCYMTEQETFTKEQERTLDLSQKIDIVRNLDRFGRKYGFSFNRFVLIGGDPLLAEDVFDFTKLLKRLGKRVSFAGNPETLTNDNCKKLKKYGVPFFNLSLDGLEKTHDKIRGEGSFQRTIEGFEQLNRFKIKSAAMITVTHLNATEFFDIINFLFYETKANGVCFDFCTHIGNASEIPSSITPEMALDISSRYLDMKKEKKKENPNFYFEEKPGFLRLLHLYRKDTVLWKSEKTKFFAGCHIGCKCQCILSDGTLLACRRLPIIIGRLPEDDFEKIFLMNETLKKYRRPQYFQDCGNCIGWNICRGCPAISSAESGNPFLKPSICFSHLLDMNTHLEHSSISMKTTHKEEASLIQNHVTQGYYMYLLTRWFPTKLSRAVSILRKDGEIDNFMLNHQKWFLEKAPNLNIDEQATLIYHVNVSRIHDRNI